MTEKSDSRSDRGDRWGRGYAALSFVFRNRFLLLLVFLFLMVIIGPILRQSLGAILGDYTENFLFVLVFLTCLRSISSRRGLFLTVLAIGAVCVALTVCNVFLRLDSIDVALFSVDALFVALICVGILWHILLQKRVDADTIMGGVCVYILLGMMWAFLYPILEYLDPGSFVSASGAEDFRHPDAVFTSLWYFSYTTLTTMGYGDIVPVTEMSRGLAVVEAVVGQMYVIVFIARLLGLHVAGHQLKLPSTNK